METVELADLGAGRDMTAGSPEGWEILPEGEKAAPGGETAAAGAPDAPPPEGEGDDIFRVKLEVFEGPLELLLHLVREHQLDIHDIPISFITDQYLRYIEMMKKFNINLASDYLVMAAYLIYIKSRTLVPQPEGEAEDEPDAESLRMELQRQLLEYQRFKRLGADLRRAEERQSGIFVRGGNGDGILLDPQDAEAPKIQVTVFDLISAIHHLIEEAGAEGVHLVEIDELEVADRQTFILDILEKAGAEGVTFYGIFRKGARVLELVATFLALLELVRRNLVLAYQDANFSEIRIVKAVNDD